MEQILVKLRNEQQAIEDSVWEKMPVDYAAFVKQWGIRYGIEQAIRIVEGEIIENEEAEKRS